MPSLALEKQVNKEIIGAGLAGCVSIEALQKLAELVEQHGRLELVGDVLREVQRERTNADAITLADIEAAVTQLRGGGPSRDDVAVISAFDIPKISYDPVSSKMYADKAPRTLFPGARAKHSLYLDRLQLIQQRMNRNMRFQQRTQLLARPGDNNVAQLTDLQSLRGVINTPRIIMGCISRAEDGRRYLLEDSSGHVVLDLSAAQCTAGFFTENCVVLAEGELHTDGVFHASALGFPPVELRENLPVASQRLPFFGTPTFSPEELARVQAEELGHLEERLIVLSDVWLDKRETLDGLGTVFAGYQALGEESMPLVFVLMGNFHSKAASGEVDYVSMRECFSTLARLIDQFPRLKSHSRFVFIPGPHDPSPSNALPQPPLPSFFTSEISRVLPNAVFASNPCRLQYLSRQVVLFRYDILKRLRRRSVMPPKGGEVPSVSSMWGQLALTLLQQSHLCPLPLVQQPIFWQYDHALHLYPLPHAVIIGDSSPQAQYEHGGCTVINPGSFSEKYFAAFLPCKQEVEMCDLLQGTRDTQYQQEHEDDDTQQQNNGVEGGAQEAGAAGGAQQQQRQGQAKAGKGGADGVAGAQRGKRGDVWAGFKRGAGAGVTGGSEDQAAAAQADVEFVDQDQGMVEEEREQEVRRNGGQPESWDDTQPEGQQGGVEERPAHDAGAEAEPEDQDAIFDALIRDEQEEQQQDDDEDVEKGEGEGQGEEEEAAAMSEDGAQEEEEENGLQQGAGSGQGVAAAGTSRRRARADVPDLDLDWDLDQHEHAGQGRAGVSAGAAEGEEGAEGGAAQRDCGGDDDEDDITEGGDDEEQEEGCDVVEGVLTGRVREDYGEDDEI